MRLGLLVGYSGAKLTLNLDLIKHAESLGFDSVWTAEAYGSDAVTPLTWIAENAGKAGTLVCAKVVEAKSNYGYNAAADRFEDLVTAGVIDPTKVVRCALENAASVATLLLTSDALIAEKSKEQLKGHGRDADLY